MKEIRLYKNSRDYLLSDRRFRVTKHQNGWFTLSIAKDSVFHEFVSSREASYINLMQRFLNNNFNLTTVYFVNQKKVENRKRITTTLSWQKRKFNIV